MKEELFDQVKLQLHHTEIPDPEAGWAQMVTLLEASKKPATAWNARSLPGYAAAACLALAVGAWALYYFAHSAGSGNAAGRPFAPTGTAIQPAHTSPAAATTAPVAASDGNSDFQVSRNAVVPIARRPDMPGLFGASLMGKDRTQQTDTAGLTPATEDPSGVLLAMTPAGADEMPGKPEATAIEIENALHPAGQVGPVHPAHHSRWTFQVGLGANFPGSFRSVTVDNQKKWKAGIFPEFNALYRLGSRFSLKLGVAAPSPVAYAKTVSHTSLGLARDSATGQFNQTVSQSQKIGRLLYLDLPVSVQWAALRHVSLEGGVQCSHLLSQQDESHTAKVASTGFLPYIQGAPVAAAAQAPPPVRRNDLRYLLGADFHWRRLSAGVQYQGGIMRADELTDEHGNTVENHTSITRMRVMYSLR